MSRMVLLSTVWMFMMCGLRPIWQIVYSCISQKIVYGLSLNSNLKSQRILALNHVRLQKLWFSKVLFVMMQRHTARFMRDSRNLHFTIPKSVGAMTSLLFRAWYATILPQTLPNASMYWRIFSLVITGEMDESKLSICGFDLLDAFFNFFVTTAWRRFCWNSS